MTVAELLSRISSAELSEWMAFHSMEPFGYDANLHGAAIVSSTVANVNRPKKRSHVFTPDEFLPRHTSTEPTQRNFVAEMKQYFQTRFPEGKK